MHAGAPSRHRWTPGPGRTGIATNSPTVAGPSAGRPSAFVLVSDAFVADLGPSTGRRCSRMLQGSAPLCRTRGHAHYRTRTWQALPRCAAPHVDGSIGLEPLLR